MSEFDDLLAQVRSGQSPTPKQPVVTDEYSSLLQQVRQPKDNSIVQSTTYNASFESPDDAAERKRLADKLKNQANEDWSPNAIDPQDAKRRLTVMDSNAALQNAPALSNRYANQDYASRTLDDVHHLSTLETLTSKLKNAQAAYGIEMLSEVLKPMETLKGAATVAGTAAIDLAGSFASFYGAGFRGLGAIAAPIFGENNWYAKAGEFMHGLGGSAEQKAADIQQQAGYGQNANYVKQMSYAAAQNVLQNLALGLPSAVERLGARAVPEAGNWFANLMSKATLEEAKALAPMGVQVAGKSAQEAYEQGATPLTEIGYAGAQGLTEIAGEMLPLGFLARDIKMEAPLWKLLRNQLVTENVSEQVTTAAQDLESWAMLPENKDKTFGDYLAERPNAALDTFVQTSLATVLQTSVIKALHNRTLNQMSAGQKAVSAEQNLNEIIDTTQATKSHKRNPADVQDLMNDIGAKDIHIDAQVASQTLNQAQLQSLASEQDIQTALQTGGDLVVPASKFAMAVASDESMRPIVEHARIDPELPSAAEAREVEAKRQEMIKQQGEMSAESEKILADAQTEKEFIASANQVSDTLTEQLKAIGRFMPGEIRAYVAPIKAFYVTQAKQMNITPSELYSRLPYNVRTGKVEQAVPSLSQAVTDLSQSPEFQSFIGNSVLKTAEGKPVVVYHGTADDVNAFDLDNPNRKDSGWLGTGVYLTTSADLAGGYAEAKKRTGGAAPNVMPLYAKLENPYYATADDKARVKAGGRAAADQFTADLQSQGYDGVIYQAAPDAQEIVVFNNAAVKSIFNRGTYSLETTDLLKQAAIEDKKQTESEAFKAFSNNAPLITSADALTHKFKTGEKLVVEAFHGTKRPDRVGTKFLKKRATSGPMAYHTSDPNLASSYATNKSDTSLSGERTDYSTWFKVKVPGQRKSMDIAQSWDYLTQEQKSKILALAPRVTFSDSEYEPDGGTVIELGPEGHTRGTGGYDQHIKETRTAYNRVGNPLKALVEEWLSSGNLYNDEERFLKVLRLAGFPMDQVTYDSPYAEYPFVYKNYIAMTNPLVSNDIPQSVIDALNEAAKKDRSKPKKIVGADMWDKNTRTLKEWVENFNSPENRTHAYVWTSIPDKVTEVFKSLGYDAIIDWSGKGGGTIAPVYIPFEETQVKSAIGNKGTYSLLSNDILRQQSRGEFAPSTLTTFLNFLQGKQRPDMSTFLHETGHFYLEAMFRMAAMPEATESMKAQAQTVLNWFGVQDLAAWNGMTLDEQRKHHEAWAYNYELYLYEGKSPSVEMQSIFDKFSAWLKELYQSIRGQLNDAYKKENGVDLPILTGEVRQVMDRLIASDEQISQAEQVRNMMPIYQTQEESGMDDSTWAAYQALQQESEDSMKASLAQDTLRQMKWMSNARSRLLREKQSELKDVRNQVRAESTLDVLKRPVYQAWQFLTGNLEEVHPQLLADQREWAKQRKQAQVLARTEVERLEWQSSMEGQKKYRKLATLNKARAKFLKDNAAEIDKQIEERMAEWDRSNPRPIPPKEKPVAGQKNLKAVDPRTDNLFVAIAKLGGLNKAKLVSEWGMDPKETVKTEIFGKPVLRSGNDGRSIDDMAELLIDYGYLTVDEHGKWDNHEFNDKFFNQLGGTNEYSMSADFDVIYGTQGQEISLADLEMRPAGRLSLSMVSPEVRDQLKRRGMTATTGLPPDLVAEFFGFKSGEEMMQQLATAVPLRDAITAETDERMLREHSDLMDPEIVQRNIERALHTEARARFVAVELRHLAKATQPVRVMLQAAKQAARQIISGKKISDIKPRDYSLAEARAAKKAIDHIKKGESIDAAKQKQAQLLQGQLAAEAVSARTEVSKAVDGFKRFFKPDEKIAKNRDMSLVNAARAILGAYGLGPQGKSPFDFVEQLRAYNPDLYADIEPIMFKVADGAKNYKELTMDEFRAMRDAVEALWFNAKRDKQIMIAGQKVELESVLTELNSRMEEIGVPATVPGETKAPSKMDRFAKTLNSTKALLRRVEHWADSFDGAAGTGAFTKYIWRPVKDALNEYRLVRNKYVKQYAELVQGLDLPVEIIDAPELNYSFGNGNAGIGKAELLGALLHTGNESNLRKLLLGREWATELPDGTLNTALWDSFIQRMIREGKLTKADFDFAQAVWDLNEEIKPMAQKAHYDMFGYHFKEVPNTPFTNQFGSYRGGYVPAKADPEMARNVQRQAKMDALESDYRNAMPSTGLGFTKARVDTNNPLSLDIRLMTNHIDSVIRFAMVQPAIKDVLKILRNRGFADTLSRIDPSAIEDMLIPWLNRSARQITSEVSKSALMDTFWRGVRQRTGVAIMFGNVRNAMQQITGYFPSSLKVRPSYLKSSLAAYISNTQKTTETVADLSKFMKNRLDSQIFDIQENINDLLLNPSKFDKLKQWVNHHGYFLQTAFQNQVDVVTWMATYNQEIAEADPAMSDDAAQAEAIQKADAAVRLTQSSLSAEDLAAFEVGTPFMKTLTHFGGYMNMMANLNVTAFTKLIRDLGWRGNKGKMLYTYLLGMALPALIGDAIMRSLGAGWDDEDDDGYLDDFMAWFFGSQGKFVVGMVPFAGQASQAAYGAFTQAQYDDKISMSPSITALESGAGAVQTGLAIFDPSKDVTGKNVRDTMTFLSVATGIPMTVLGRPIGYAVDVSRGKIEPTSAYDLARGLVTGVASNESKSR